jgi:hypothetical protein
MKVSGVWNIAKNTFGSMCTSLEYIEYKFLHFLSTKSDAKEMNKVKRIVYLRFRHLGQYFMEPSDYYDAPINKVLHFIRSIGLIKG